MTTPKVKTFQAKGSRFYVHPETNESVPSHVDPEHAA